MNVEVNYFAVIVAAVLSMVVGFLWYSPTLFGKPWMKLMGMAENFFHYSKVMTGLTSGFWMWFGFVMPVQATATIFGDKKWQLFGINSGYQLVTLVLMGLVIGIIG